MHSHFPPPVSSMTLGDLKRLIKTGESSFLEFKKTISSPEKIAREICAFANSKGGILLIGVNDDKSVVGVPSYYEEQHLLAEATGFYCDPPINHSVEIVETGQREVIVVRIQESEKKPVRVNLNGRKLAYVREKDKSVRASKERTELLRLGNRNEGVTFQYGPNEQKLFRFLNEYDKITVSEYSRLASVSKKASTRILVNLASIGVLKLFSGNEHQDYFMLSN